MGRLTRDPELRHTQQGTAVASCSLAVDRDFKSRDGDKETDFIDIVAWRNTGEFLAKHFTKGRMAVVEGRLQVRDFTDRDGNKRRTAEVVVENVYFADSKKEDPLAAFTKAHPETVTDDRFAEIQDDGGDNLPF
jgi:single-strand DNA-binding protein